MERRRAKSSIAPSDVELALPSDSDEDDENFRRRRRERMAGQFNKLNPPGPLSQPNNMIMNPPPPNAPGPVRRGKKQRLSSEVSMSEPPTTDYETDMEMRVRRKFLQNKNVKGAAIAKGPTAPKVGKEKEGGLRYGKRKGSGDGVPSDAELALPTDSDDDGENLRRRLRENMAGKNPSQPNNMNLNPGAGSAGVGREQRLSSEVSMSEPPTTDCEAEMEVRVRKKFLQNKNVKGAAIAKTGPASSKQPRKEGLNVSEEMTDDIQTDVEEEELMKRARERARMEPRGGGQINEILGPVASSSQKQTTKETTAKEKTPVPVVATLPVTSASVSSSRQTTKETSAKKNPVVPQARLPVTSTPLPGIGGEARRIINMTPGVTPFPRGRTQEKEEEEESFSTPVPVASSPSKQKRFGRFLNATPVVTTRPSPPKHSSTRETPKSNKPVNTNTSKPPSPKQKRGSAELHTADKSGPSPPSSLPSNSETRDETLLSSSVATPSMKTRFNRFANTASEVPRPFYGRVRMENEAAALPLPVPSEQEAAADPFLPSARSSTGEVSKKSVNLNTSKSPSPKNKRASIAMPSPVKKSGQPVSAASPPSLHSNSETSDEDEADGDPSPPTSIRSNSETSQEEEAGDPSLQPVVRSTTGEIAKNSVNTSKSHSPAKKRMSLAEPRPTAKSGPPVSVASPPPSPDHSKSETDEEEEAGDPSLPPAVGSSTREITKKPVGTHSPSPKKKRMSLKSGPPVSVASPPPLHSNSETSEEEEEADLPSPPPAHSGTGEVSEVTKKSLGPRKPPLPKRKCKKRASLVMPRQTRKTRSAVLATSSPPLHSNSETSEEQEEADLPSPPPAHSGTGEVSKKSLSTHQPPSPKKKRTSLVLPSPTSKTGPPVSVQPPPPSPVQSNSKTDEEDAADLPSLSEEEETGHLSPPKRASSGEISKKPVATRKPPPPKKKRTSVVMPRQTRKTKTSVLPSSPPPLQSNSETDEDAVVLLPPEDEEAVLPPPPPSTHSSTAEVSKKSVSTHKPPSPKKKRMSLAISRPTAESGPPVPAASSSPPSSPLHSNSETSEEEEQADLPLPPSAHSSREEITKKPVGTRKRKPPPPKTKPKKRMSLVMPRQTRTTRRQAVPAASPPSSPAHSNSETEEEEEAVLPPPPPSARTSTADVSKKSVSPPKPPSPKTKRTSLAIPRPTANSGPAVSVASSPPSPLHSASETSNEEEEEAVLPVPPQAEVDAAVLVLPPPSPVAGPSNRNKRPSLVVRRPSINSRPSEKRPTKPKPKPKADLPKGRNCKGRSCGPPPCSSTCFQWKGECANWLNRKLVTKQLLRQEAASLGLKLTEEEQRTLRDNANEVLESMMDELSDTTPLAYGVFGFQSFVQQAKSHGFFGGKNVSPQWVAEQLKKSVKKEKYRKLAEGIIWPAENRSDTAGNFERA